MFQPNDIESAARQQQSASGHEAEQIEVDETALSRQSGCNPKHWVGAHMIKLGLKLQGYPEQYEREFILE